MNITVLKHECYFKMYLNALTNLFKGSYPEKPPLVFCFFLQVFEFLFWGGERKKGLEGLIMPTSQRPQVKRVMGPFQISLHYFK